MELDSYISALGAYVCVREREKERKGFSFNVQTHPAIPPQQQRRGLRVKMVELESLVVVVVVGYSTFPACVAEHFYLRTPN